MKRDPNLEVDLKLFGEWISDAVSKSDNLRLIENPMPTLNTLTKEAERRWLLGLMALVSSTASLPTPRGA